MGPSRRSSRHRAQVAPVPIAALAYTADGTHLIVAEPPSALYQVDAATLLPVGPRVALAYSIRGVVAGPDGTAVAVFASAIAGVDLDAGRVLRTVSFGFSPRAVDIAPDGRHVAVVCDNGDFAMVDIEAGRIIVGPTFGADAAQVTYAPDGATFASAGASGLIGLWDGPTGTPLGTSVRPGAAAWTTAEYLPDGYTLLIATLTGAVYTWDTRPEDWIDHACAVAGRNLTADEWRDTFGDRPYHDTC